MRVLLADDNRDAALTLSSLLGDEGHVVEEVYTGSDVLPAMQSFKPDAVLLDIKMPGLSGYDVARQIRRRYGVLPLLIAISGHYKQTSDELLCEIAGFDYHVPKPCDPNALLALLKD
jgi:two-component system, OmpR family, response regulator